MDQGVNTGVYSETNMPNIVGFDMQNTDNYLQKTGNDMQNTCNDMQNTDNNFQKIGNNMQKTSNDMQNTDKDLQKTGNDMQKTCNDMQNTDNNLQKTGNNMQKTSNDMQNTDLNFQKKDNDLQKTSNDMQNRGNNLSNLQDKHWETQHVNDVSISDIHRAVNAFLFGLGSSTQGSKCLKKELDNSLRGGILCQSNTNNEANVGRSHTNAHSGALSQLADAAATQSYLRDRGLQRTVHKATEATVVPGNSKCEKFASGVLSQTTVTPLISEGSFICPIKECNMKLKTKNKLNTHVMANHKEEGFRCMTCGKKFNRLYNLEQHSNVHTGVKPFKCEICGKKFHSRLILNNHHRGTHVDPLNKLQCEICGVVGNSSFMSKHRRNVHLKLRYHCTECRQDFRLVRYLKDHMRTHRGEDPYKCDLCGNTFELKNSVLQHLKRHSRQHQCPKCNKAFKSKYFLQGHLLQHDGIKKFCCNECGKTFTHAHYLVTHKLSHGEKAFDCAICGGRFNRKDNLKSHILRHQTTGRTNLRKK